MNRSESTFAKATFNPSSKSWTGVNVVGNDYGIGQYGVGTYGGFGHDIGGTSSFAKMSFTLSRKPWTGDNAASSAFGYDKGKGTPLGVGPLSGISHFAGVTQPTVSHI